MKRKRSIPGMRLLLCALLAAALVGVTQRAEAAYSEPDSSIITISPKKVSDKGNCQETWWEWGEDPNNSVTQRRFRVNGPWGANNNSEKPACKNGNDQNQEHTGALVFKNVSSLPGTLTIEYTYQCYAQNSSQFKFWVFPKKTDGSYSVDPAEDSIDPNTELSDPTRHYSGTNPGDVYTTRTATAKLAVGQEARLVVWIRNSPQAGASRAYADIYISSVKFVAEGKPVDVTFQAPESYKSDSGKNPGTYVVNYGSTSYDMTKNSDDQTVRIQSDTKVTLTATPISCDNGDNNRYYVFRDWYDVNNKKTLSTSATFEAYFSDNKKITARYINLYTTPLFEVDGQTFTDLKDAIECAQSGNWKTVRLVKSGGIYSGEYTIPEGVTLLLPYEKDNQPIWNVNPDKWQTFPCKEKPEIEDCTKSKGAATDFESVKLTLKNDAKLIVENGGAIEVGGMCGVRQGMHDGCFAPVRRYGWLFLDDSNSSITVKNGGKLCAWGYITGSGTVTAESGSELRELFQIMDWCGGEEANDKNLENVFPITQYYVQNIEAELILKYGAKETAVATIMAGGSYSPGEAPLIGSEEGMFQMQRGAELRRKYSTATDRIEYTVLNGTVSLSSIKLDVSIAAFKVNLDSSKFVLPINGNTTVTIKEGATLNVTSDTSLLPGTQVYINYGGTLAVADSAHLYIYDSEQWMKKAYCYQGAHFQAVDFTPGKKGDNVRPLKIRTDADLVDVMIDVNGTLKGNNIYTTGTSGTAEANGGANVCSSGGTGKYVREGAVKEGLLKQKVQDQTADVIDITPIKLKNGANASPVYTETGNAKVTYYYNNFSKMWGTQLVVNVTLNYNYDGAEIKTIQSTEKLLTPTRTGYIFKGWNTDPKGAGTPYEAGEVHSFTSDTTLYAQWEAKTYTLKLNENYGSTTTGKDTLQLKKADGTVISNNGKSLAFTVAYDDVIVLPEPTEFISSYAGSKFLGWKPMWCKDQDNTYSAKAEITISDKLVKNGSNDEIWIYAQWKREYYTVTAESRSFSTQDKWDEVPLNPSGKGGLVDANPMADVSLDGTGTYKLAETVTVVAPEKDGYTFKGWYCGYKWDSPKYRIYHFSDDLAVSISSKDLAEKCNILTEYNRNSTGHIRLVAVYTPKTETTNLTLTLDKAPGATVTGGGTKNSDGTWSVPVGTEVTIDASNVPGFQYWTNANDKVMSTQREYTFIMVTNTTLTAETSTSSTFVIFQSADGRLLSVQSDLNALKLPDAPYRVGYTFAGWKVGSASNLVQKDTELADNLKGKTGTVNVVAAYEGVSAKNLTVTVYVGGSADAGMSQSNLTLGDIAKFTAPAESNGSYFRFWASNKDGANILSFSTTYSFRVTKGTTIYAIYGDKVTDKPPVVRVDNVLKNPDGQTKSLTFMIGASIPEGYQLVEMGALYATTSADDTTLRVENVDNNTVRKAVSKLTQQKDLTDYSYALGFKVSDSQESSKIYLRGYVAVKKANDSTIYYYYSGVHSASYQSLSGTSSLGG